jgi:predicted ATPase
VEARRQRPLADVLVELNEAHARTLELVAAIPEERLRQPGTLPWYGDPYALDDLIVYQYYGHKREHAAQIEAFRDRQSQLV